VRIVENDANTDPGTEVDADGTDDPTPSDDSGTES
jgi:hypothetical protein